MEVIAVSMPMRYILWRNKRTMVQEVRLQIVNKIANTAVDPSGNYSFRVLSLGNVLDPDTNARVLHVTKFDDTLMQALRGTVSRGAYTALVRAFVGLCNDGLKQARPGDILRWDLVHTVPQTKLKLIHSA